MNTTTLIAILASVLLPARGSKTPPAESYEWVAGEVRRWELGYSNCSERFDSPRK